MTRSPYSLPVFVREDSSDAWKLRGICRDYEPDVFFPSERNRAASQQARSICNRCPVQTECAQWAFTHDEAFGVWGGITEQERRHDLRTYKKPGHHHRN